MLTRTRVVLTSVAVAATLLPTAAVASAGPKVGQNIYGGYYPSPSAWPWVTALQNKTYGGDDFNKNSCTAVLVAPQRVLTAAHCVVGADNRTPEPATNYEVIVGRRDLRNTGQGERRQVTGIVVHPKVYMPDTGAHRNHAFYDIAVLFLEQPVSIPPAPIGAPDSWNSNGATAMGWGHTNLTSNSSERTFDPNLKAADFALFSDAQCAGYFNTAQTQHFYPSIHVCAGNLPNATKVSCITHGDSGGPLMVWDNNRWELIGITSFYPQRSDPQCPGHGGPFGFAWVAGSEMRDWPLTVEPPPVVNTSTGGGNTGGGDNTGGDNTGGGDTGGGNTGTTPVEPLDLTMTRSQALGYVRNMIRGETNGSIKRLKRSCKVRTYSSYRCRVSFKIGRRSYSGTAVLRHYEEDNEAYWTYSFKGKRRQPGGTTRKVSW
jgi:hypothetical protein